MSKYDFNKIEKKWQKKWLKERVHKATDFSEKPKYYQLETFPYPSAAGLHVGHPKGYVAEDIHARFQRMNGHEVLYAMGWDAFGLPTENYAIKVGKTPQEVATANIKNFKRQVQMFGLSYDWDREINTSDPSYYKWTQWLFIQLFKKGLAYKAKAKVNWCPKDQTVLANEQVVDGKCERCGSVIEQREMEQWFLKITNYAERLLEDLKGLDWPEATIKRQLDWIGKSEGALIQFPISNFQFSNKESNFIEIFTTRPDTIFGATYLVLAPEHELLTNNELGIRNYEEVKRYVEQASHKTELMRQEQGKTGVELMGIKAINPANNEEISIWVADYVLPGYGTGAIMAVPAHDQRDFEFATKFNLPIIDRPLTDKKEIIKKINATKTINYKLRDWSVSRQRYWGVPIPMVHCESCGIVPVPDKDLPVLLPMDVDYRPKGMPPLASSKKFMSMKCPKCGEQAKRDSETLDAFVDSSWYYLRYADSQNESQPFNKLMARYWLPVDLYVIGAEHTVLHLLYSRFITKFLHDEGYLNFKEPFLKIKHVGLLLGTDGQKMSKSKGNVVNPDEIVEEFGADTVRLYEMFMGPFENGQPWDAKGVMGVHRFLNRIHNLIISNFQFPISNQFSSDKNNKLEKLLHQTIKKVTEDIRNFKFNTAISALMILVNELEKTPNLKIENCKLIIKLLFPFAPHMAQELWSNLGNASLLDYEQWPQWDVKLVEEENVEIVVQVNGKVRGRFTVARGSSQEEVKELALSESGIRKWVGNSEIKKVIFIADRLINFLV